MDVLASRCVSGFKLYPPIRASKVAVVLVCLCTLIAPPRILGAEENRAPADGFRPASSPTASEKLQNLLTSLGTGQHEDQATQS